MTLGWHDGGWARAPARLAREDVATLRRLYVAARAVTGTEAGVMVEACLHVDRDDSRKLALAKLGSDAPRVRVQATVHENNISVTVHAIVRRSSNDIVGAGQSTARHKFQRRAHVKEWTRILGRHCRHALGVVAHLRAEMLVRSVPMEVVRFAPRLSKVS